MLIVGAKGFAKEVLEIILHEHLSNEIVFFDDLSIDGNKKLYDKYRILRNLKEASNYFQQIDNRFTLGLGNPIIREQLRERLESAGGILCSSISHLSHIGSHDVSIGVGVNILPGAKISNSTFINDGCIVYYNSIITHDVYLGKFVEVSPNSALLGRCRIGDYTKIGANSTVLPDISVGKNCIVGAGSVVTKDVPDNTTVFGVPARIVSK